MTNNIALSLNKYGLELLSTNRPDEALGFFREAILHDATFVDAHTNLGVALFLNRQYDDAIAAFDTSLALRPDHAETLLNASYTVWMRQDFQRAKTMLEQAVAIADAPVMHIALGKLLREIGDNEGAIRHLTEGLKHEPHDYSGQGTLREVYHHYGDEALAVAQCDEMIRLMPNHPLHPYKKAVVLLTYGNEEGWHDQECRYNVSSDGLSTAGRADPQLYARLITQRWDGTPTGHLLVHREQGFGDNIQFLRFVPKAAERCEKLTLFLPPTLRRLAKQVVKDCPNVEISDDLHSPTQFDHWCLLMSLPYLLDMTTEYPTAPYLFAPKEQYGEIRRLKGLKVGIAWKGNPGHEDDRWRSIPFEKMAKLFDVPANFVSLHFPSEVDKKYPLLDVHPTPTSYYGHLMIDWTETAAIIDALDLVVAADTSVIHMAGAMGKPVWLINRYNSDWRWGLGRSATPWYPSLKIFRQPKLGDWDTVIDQVVGELRKL